MISKCKVLMNNEAVTVANVDGIHVQFPSIHRKADYVSVYHDGGDFHIVDDAEAEKPNEQNIASVAAEPAKKAKPRRKKTVVEEIKDE